MPFAVNEQIVIPDEELEFSAIRAQGAGGQNVNKVASAIHLRFNVATSSLPEACRERLLNMKDARISKEGVVVIKAQRFRTQEKNREDALERLRNLILKALHMNKPRIATKPSRAAKARRVDAKTQRGQTKALRGKIKGRLHD